MQTARLKSRIKAAETKKFFIYISPWLICFCVFGIVPLVFSLYISFTQYNISRPPVWCWFDNYVRIFQDFAFKKAVINTTLYVVIKVPLIMILSLAAALLLNGNIKGKSAFRLLFYFPAVMPAVASVMVWVFIYEYEGGLLNMFLGIFNIEPVQWFDTKHALGSIILMSLWGIGPGMVIYLAALQGVPRVYYEAIEIDGGNRFDSFVNITLPMISPVLLYQFLMNLIAGIQIFSEIYLATGGGPNNATISLNLLIYQYAFSNPIRMGLASALAWVLLAVTLILSLVTFKVSDKFTYYDGK